MLICCLRNLQIHTFITKISRLISIETKYVRHERELRLYCCTEGTQLMATSKLPRIFIHTFRFEPVQICCYGAYTCCYWICNGKLAHCLLTANYRLVNVCGAFAKVERLIVSAMQYCCNSQQRARVLTNKHANHAPSNAEIVEYA